MPRRPRRLAVADRVADEHRAPEASPPARTIVSTRCRGSGFCQGRLSAPSSAAKPPGDPERLQQQPRQPLGLVGADREPPAVGLQPVERRLGAVVEPGLDRERRGVALEQPRIERLDRRLVGRRRARGRRAASPARRRRPSPGRARGRAASRARPRRARRSRRRSGRRRCPPASRRDRRPPCALPSAFLPAPALPESGARI